MSEIMKQKEGRRKFTFVDIIFKLSFTSVFVNLKLVISLFLRISSFRKYHLNYMNDFSLTSFFLHNSYA